MSLAISRVQIYACLAAVLRHSELRAQMLFSIYEYLNEKQLKQAA
jgi:hypothetical protein